MRLKNFKIILCIIFVLFDGLNISAQNLHTKNNPTSNIIVESTKTDSTILKSSVYEDKFGNMTGSDKHVEDIYYYVWQNEEMKWNIKEYYNNFFDSDNNLTEFTSSLWDPNECSYTNRTKSTYIHENGKLKEETNYDFSGFKWNGNTRKVYSYDSLDHIIEIKHLRWSLDGTEWYPSQRRVNIYDTLFNIKQVDYYDYRPAEQDWVETQKITYQYSTNLDTSEQTVHLWDTVSQNWKPERKSYILTTNSGELIETTTQLWDTAIDGWLNYENVVINYIDSGLISERNRYEWDVKSNDWHPYSKREYKYDESNRLKEYVTYSWDDIYSKLVIYEKTEYVYDTETGRWKHSLRSKWDQLNEIWQYQSKYDAEFDPNTTECFTTNIGLNVILDLEIFPNPCFKYLNIITSNDDSKKIIKVINPTGKQLMQHQFNGTNYKLNIETLAPGLYFLVIENKDNLLLSKFIVQ